MVDPRVAADTSVVVAAFSTWHEFHSVARGICESKPLLPIHAALEVYSVLTRMPDPFRAPAQVVAQYLALEWEQRLILPSQESIAALPARCSNAGITGGSIYDVLIGVTAADNACQLVTLDRRAMLNVMALGVDARLLVP